MDCRLAVSRGTKLGLVAVLVIAGLAAGRARAQATWGPTGQPMQAQAPTFKYYVWGQVRAPGAYSLGANPDLIELLSAAGGPTQEANLRRVMLVSAVDQKRTRLNVSRLLAKGNVVPLSPGDVVIVPRSGWYTIRDEFWIVTTAAILVNLGLTIYALTGGTE